MRAHHDRAQADRSLVGVRIAVYLRTKGINPEDHAVLPELKRVQTYFNKIQQAEFPEKRQSLPSDPCPLPSRAHPLLTRPFSPLLCALDCTGKFQVDRPAAARFIKSALASNSLPSSASESDIGMQTRFNILKHQEATLHDSSSDDDSEPEATGTKTVFGADGKKVESKVAKHLLSGASAGTPKGKGKGKGKGKADLKVVVGEGVHVVDGGAQERAVEGSPMVTGVAGKKRSRVDPFAGESRRPFAASRMPEDFHSMASHAVLADLLLTPSPL